MKSRVADMTGSRFAHIYKEHRSLCLILNLVGSASSVGLFHFQTGSLSWREVEERDVLQRQAGVRARSNPCILLRGLALTLRLGEAGKNFKVGSDTG